MPSNGSSIHHPTISYISIDMTSSNSCRDSPRRRHHLHLLLTNAKKLIIGLHDNVDELEMLASKLFIAPLLQIFHNLENKMISGRTLATGLILGIMP